MSAPNQPSETIQTKAPSRAGLYAAIAVIVVIVVVVAGLYAAGYLTPKSKNSTTGNACASTGPPWSGFDAGGAADGCVGDRLQDEQR